MPTWKITLEYDGSNYHGWQEQTNAKAVANEVKRAAEEFLGTPVELQGSGRTDSGVHALAQVAHLRAETGPATAAELVKGLNDKLPTSIVVLNAEETHDRFHARHDAVARAYVYRFSTRRTAFEKKYVWWIKDKLDLSRMQLAAQKFIGRHDFSAFAQKDPSKTDDSTIVVVNEAGVLEEDNLILFRIEASHFLWKMVRRLAGVLVKVGTGELALSEVDRFLRGEADPRIATWTAPASGLFLERVSYEAVAAAPAVQQEESPRPAKAPKRAPPARAAYAASGDRPPARRYDKPDGPPPRRNYGDDRPPARRTAFGDDRPPARRPAYGDDRPPRPAYGDKKPYEDKRPPRAAFGEKKPYERPSYGDKKPAGRYDDTRPPRRDYGTSAKPPSRPYEDRRPPTRAASRESDAPYPARRPRRADEDQGGARGDAPFRPRTPYAGTRSDEGPRSRAPRDDRDQRPPRESRGFSARGSDGPPPKKFGPKGPGGPKKFAGPKKSFGGPKKSFGGPKKFGAPKRGGKPPKRG